MAWKDSAGTVWQHVQNTGRAVNDYAKSPAGKQDIDMVGKAICHGVVNTALRMGSYCALAGKAGFGLYEWLKNDNKQPLQTAGQEGAALAKTTLQGLAATAIIVGSAGARFTYGLGKYLTGRGLNREELKRDGLNLLIDSGRVLLIVGATVLVVGEVKECIAGDVLILEAGDKGLFPDFDIDKLEGIANGTADSAAVDELINLGELKESHSIDSADIVRSAAVRSEFLSMHGYDEAPEGYDVHHIIPLKEGGADVPENMVLLKHEDHLKITAAHRAFYDWPAFPATEQS